MEKVIKFSVIMVFILSSLLSCSKKQINTKEDFLIQEETNIKPEVFEPKQYKEKSIILYKKDIDIVTFPDNEFKISLNPERKYDINNLAPILVNNRPIEIELAFSCDIITITEVSNTEYWFNFEALGYEDIKIINPKTLEVTEPFFDMKDSVSILRIDFENKVLFGVSWNSDKDFPDTQLIDYYLFSTKQNKRYKIETFTGEIPKAKFVDFHTIQFTKSSGETVTYDYGMWI